MEVTASHLPSFEKSNAAAVVCVNSQYDNGLYFIACSRSFLPAVMGRADDVSDLWTLRVGGGILEVCPWELVCGLSGSMFGGNGLGEGNCVSSRSLSIRTMEPSWKRATKVFSERGIQRIAWTGVELIAP